jgi:hypothetical protein
MLSSVYLLPVGCLLIKFYLDTSISRYIFIVKIFLEILLTFSPRPAALRTDPPAGDIDPRQPGRVSLENPAKIKKIQDIT